MTQFLVETVVLSSLGGIVGIAIGWVVSILGAKAAGRTVRSQRRYRRGLVCVFRGGWRRVRLRAGSQGRATRSH
jgi:ABC-type antimicrobial peptide transport system permease subunit